MKMGAAAALLAGGVGGCGGGLREREATFSLPTPLVGIGGGAPGDGELLLRLPGGQLVPLQPVSQSADGSTANAVAYRAAWEESSVNAFGVWSAVRRVQRNGQVHTTVLSTGLYLPDGNSGAHMDRIAQLRADLGMPNPSSAQRLEGAQASTLSPRSVAEQIVFYHPDLMALDADVATVVKAHIQSSPFFYELGTTIAQRPYTDGGPNAWCENVMLVDDDTGQPLVDASNHVAYDVRVADDIMVLAGKVMRDVLRTVQADTQLQDVLWTADAGSDAPTVDSGLARASTSGYEMVNTQQEAIAGVTFKSVPLNGDRKVKLVVENSYLRYLTIYAEFINAQGRSVSVSDADWADAFPLRLGDSLTQSSSFLQAGQHSRLVQLLAPTKVFMGVPVLDAITEIPCKLPTGCSGVRLKLGTLGNGPSRTALGHNGDGVTLYTNEKVWGIVLTAVINYAFPALGLAWGGYTVKKVVGSLISDLAKDPGVLLTSVVTYARDLGWVHRDQQGLDQDVVWDAMAHANLNLFITLADRLLKWMMKQGGQFLIILAKLTAAAAVDNASSLIPFVGWGLRAISITTTVAELMQTSIQCATQSGYIVNELRLAMSVRVRISPDLDNAGWPALARYYRIHLQKDGETFYKTEWKALASPAAFEETLPGIPSGGNAQIIVVMADEPDGRLLARGYAATYRVDASLIATLPVRTAEREPVPSEVANKLTGLLNQTYQTTSALLGALTMVLTTADIAAYQRSIVSAARQTDISLILAAGETALAVDCPMEQFLTPINASTRYLHERVLDYAAGSYRWQATAQAPAPQALSCNSNQDSLCELGNITLSQRNGQLGYSWRSASSALLSCTTNTANAQLYTAQNLSAGDDPNTSRRTLTSGGTACGIAAGVSLVYELMGPADGSGDNYLLDGRSGLLHVRRINNTRSTSLALDTLSGSYGTLAQQPTSLVLHPRGYLVAVHATAHKLEVLRLAATPYTDSAAPGANLLSGIGQREGRLLGPTCVAVTSTGTVLVLESLGRRVQALDISGNPVPLFGNRSSPRATFPLQDRGTAVTYLDMGVDVTGYVYVLSHAGAGTAASDYVLDIYDPRGAYLTSTAGFTAGRMLVDRWRSIYTLNRQTLRGPGGRVEPSVSRWNPSST